MLPRDGKGQHWFRFLVTGLAVLVALCSLEPGEAMAKSTKAKKKKTKKTSEKISVPVDVGIGPALNHVFGAVGDAQTFHYGVKIDLCAVITKEVIEANKDKIPAKYRKMAMKLNGIRYYPFWWLPDTIFVSPKIDHSQMYGITFRPLHLGLSLASSDTFDISVSAGLILTYAYIQDDRWTEKDTTHFLRPGIDLRAEMIWMPSDSFGISVGWASGFYVPQAVNQDGMGIFDVPGFGENSIWHNGQAFVLLHFRFPYQTSL